MVYKFYVNGKFRASCGDKRKEEVKSYIEDKYKGQNIKIKKVESKLSEEEIKKILDKMEWYTKGSFISSLSKR